MAGTLNEKDLEHLDKQTLITLLVSTNASNAASRIDQRQQRCTP